MKRWLVLGCLLSVLGGGSHAHAQGCSQCRDNVSGSSPKVQRAFRRGIAVMAVPAVLLLAGFMLAARKTSPDEDN